MARLNYRWLLMNGAGWSALFVASLSVTGDMRDARAYYDAGLDGIYASSTFLSTGYVYSPAFALIIEPFRWFDPTVLFITIRVASTIALGYLVTPWFGAVLIVGQFPGLREELGVGNLDLIVAAILVSVLAKPWLWPTLLLTKVTPGVGLVWHLVRQEWRALAVAGAATIAIVAVSLPFTGDAWVDWFDVLTGENIAIADAHVVSPLWLRGSIGIALAAYAGWTDRAWLVPLAVAVSFPNPNIAHWLVLLAIPRMLQLIGRHPIAAVRRWVDADQVVGSSEQREIRGSG